MLCPPSADSEARAVSPQPQDDAGPVNGVKDAGDLPGVLSAMPQLERTPSRRQVTEDFDPNSHDTLYASIPTQLREGTTMLKVSAKKVQRRLVKLRAEAGQLLWESKHAGMRKSCLAALPTNSLILHCVSYSQYREHTRAKVCSNCTGFPRAVQGRPR